MSSAPQGSLQYLGKGALYFDRFSTAGASTGFRFMGNVNGIDLGVAVEKLTLKSSVTAGAPTLAEAITGQTHTIAVKTTEYDQHNIAAFLMGNRRVFTQTGAAVVGEGIDGCLGDRWYKLSHVKIASSPAPVVKVGLTTLTVTDDYEIDYDYGRIYIVEGGAAAGADITVDYTYSTIAWHKTSAAEVGSIVGSLEFRADPAHGPAHFAQFWRVSMTPNGQLSMISDQWGEFGFNFEVLDDSTNHAAPDNYYRIIWPS